jgi:SPX domain protein involved in polyphosphate accumulation
MTPLPACSACLQAFNRSTTKFWVRTSDVSTVKRIIIENMPVFVFNKASLHAHPSGIRTCMGGATGGSQPASQPPSQPACQAFDPDCSEAPSPLHCPPQLQLQENYSGDAQLVNSVYFDNDSLELYHGRLDKRPGAIALRIRCAAGSWPLLVTAR